MSSEVKKTTNMFSKLGGKLLGKNKQSGKNYKYDFTEGKRHKFLVSGHKFDVDEYYVPHKAVGSGAYGVVCTAVDKRYGEKKVVIKKCANAFDDIIDGKRILREIKLLHYFNHPNLISISDCVYPQEKEENLKEYNDVYMILEHMESDLHKIIYSKNKLTNEHFQYFAYQILKGLKYIHSCGVVHRDLKPSNLLVNSNCDLKICDFGLARGLDWDQVNLTEYVVTRWYRAPEIMCSAQKYDENIDIWSVGCIIAEMATKKPLLCGDHYIHQLNLIFDLIGTPNKNDIKCITNPKALKYISKLKPRKRKLFKNVFKGKSPHLIDLLDKMLVFNPTNRISVEGSLQHQWFKNLYKPISNPINDPDINKEKKIDFDWEYKVGDRKKLKQQMLLACKQIRQQSQEEYKQYKQQQQPKKEE